MRTNTSTPKNEKETLDYIDKAAGQLDEQRLAALQEEQHTQLIKDEILQREIKRLEAKHGQSHPAVLAARTRVMYNRDMFVSLDKEIEKASIKTEPLPAQAWRVHGRVFESQSKAVKGVTVFLSDANGRWVEVLGSFCTTELGYYSLTVEEKLIDKFEKQPLVLTVSDKNKKVIYAAREPFFISRGLIIYKDIYLKQEECVPPPGGTRVEGKEEKDLNEEKDIKQVKRKTE